MKWWKRKLAEAAPAASEAAEARLTSEQALDRTERMGPRVDSVTKSLDITRTNNHFVIRIAAAYGYTQPGKASE